MLLMSFRSAVDKLALLLKTRSEVNYHEAEQLLIAVCDVSRTQIYTDNRALITATQWTLLHQLAQRRQQGCPLAYLLGSQYFDDLHLAINRHTLIPRPDSEILLQTALRLGSAEHLRVADLGTGSGALGLAMAYHRPKWQVWLTDRCQQALEVARYNAANLSLQEVHFAQGHWGEALPGGLWDLWVSNPPYVSSDDPHLKDLALQFEPKHALISGPDGLNAIRVLVLQARRYLKTGGWLILEHGAAQASSVRRSLMQSGFIQVATECDSAGWERVSYGQWSNNSFSDR